MSTDNNKRPSRLGRGLTSLMSGVQPAPPVTVDAPTPPPTDAPRARLASAPPPELLAQLTESTKPDSASPTPHTPYLEVALLDVTRIAPNPYQPRKQFDHHALEQLAASIRIDGVIQPILVRVRPGTSDQYELIAGERRWRAAQLAGLAAIPAIVRKIEDQETAEWALVENLQREDLNPIERAEAFQQLVDRYQLSHEQVADRVGVDRSTITNTLRLLGLHGDVQQFVRDGLLSAGQARAIAGLADAEAQRVIAVQTVRDAWSVRQVEQAVRDLAEAADSLTAPASASKRKPSTAHNAELEQQISQQLGTKVRLQQGKKKGTGSLTIEFYTAEQFDDLLAKLGVKLEIA